MKKLAKLVTGVAASASMLYWLAVPAMAAPTTVDLCNSAQSTGFGIPCGPDITIATIVSFAVNTLLFAAFVLALVFLIIGGIRWIMSGGDKEATGKAKNTVTSALIGLVVVVGAWVLINIVLQLLTGSGLGEIKLQNLSNQTTTGTSPGCINGQLYVGNGTYVPC